MIQRPAFLASHTLKNSPRDAQAAVFIQFHMKVHVQARGMTFQSTVASVLTPCTHTESLG